MKKFKQKINDISLKNKLAIIYVVTGLIPLIVLFLFAYGQMRNILMDRDLKSVKGALEQSVTTADGQIEVYDNLSNYITFNDTLSGVLSYDYKSTYEMYSQIVTTFDPMLSSLKYFHDDINRVTIYVDKKIKHDTTIAPIEEIENEPFYQAAIETTKIQWFVDEQNKTLVSARKMSTLDQLGILGIIYIDVDYDSVMNSFTGGLEQDCGMVVVDADGRVICSSDTFGNGNTRYRLSSDKLLSLTDKAEWDDNACVNMEGYSIVKQESPATGWTVYVYEPRTLVLRSANSIIAMIAVALIVTVAGAATASVFASDFVTRRINELKNSMEKVENGDFDAVINTQDKDEIGDLIHSFNSMTRQIKNLITQVYEGQLSQKESEMRALRAQINPHFLYNSLSLINWKAIEYEQEDISEITLALSNYYRTSLNKGRNTLSFEQELSNMQSYLKIQQIMHDNSFDVIINVSEEVLSCESLNLILQPLVENSIDHGIDLLTDRKGKITINAQLQPDTNGTQLVYIELTDNGIGMDKETAENFLTAQSKGYGARNVNERIRLYYGEQYHLEVRSTLGAGTTITIKFPAKPHNTKN